MTITPFWQTVTQTDPLTSEVVSTTYVPNTNIPSPSEVRNRWCYGLPLTNEAGIPLSDEDIKIFIDGAIGTMRRRLGVFLKPTTIVCNPDFRGLEKGVDYEVEESAYDYDIAKYKQWGFMQLKERHVQKINGLKMVLPNGNVIMDFMTRPEWIKLYKDAGQLHIVPYAGDPTLFALLGGSSSGFPFATGSLNAQLPQMFYVDYEAGFPLYEIPDEIRNIIAKMASIDVLGIAGDAVLAGVASLSTSIDGLSESFSTTASATNATYGAHILQYQKEIDSFFKKGDARSSYRGITMIGL
jgi:hypothetical protein